jgi:RNA polymerase sigma-70 factor (ECF subfamily)
MSASEKPENSIPPDPAKARAGAAFAEYHQALQDYLARRLSRAEDVRDLVQEVFLRFLRIEQTRLVENPQAFLYGIASNVVLERRRLRQRQRVIFSSHAVEHGSEHPANIRPDELTDSLVLERQIEEVSTRLTPTQLRILTYWRRDGLSFEQIAPLLDLSPHTIKKYAVQAIALIRTSCQ